MRPCTIWITEGINNSGKEFKAGEIALPPAYFSVAIFVEEFPPKEILDEMRQRAKIFWQNPASIYEKAKSYIDARTNTDLKLTGYRLLEPHVEKILEEKVTSMNLKKIRF